MILEDHNFPDGVIQQFAVYQLPGPRAAAGNMEILRQAIRAIYEAQQALHKQLTGLADATAELASELAQITSKLKEGSQT